MTAHSHDWYTDKGINLTDRMTAKPIPNEIFKEFYNILITEFQGIHVTPKEIHGFFSSKYPTHKEYLPKLMKKLVKLGLPKSKPVFYKNKTIRIYTIPTK